jgi:hypothetical protein
MAASPLRRSDPSNDELPDDLEGFRTLDRDQTCAV